MPYDPHARRLTGVTDAELLMMIANHPDRLAQQALAEVLELRQEIDRIIAREKPSR